MAKFIQLLISGVATGSIIGLVALGFVLIYKATDVFNFAHGDFMMLAAYLGVTFITTLDLPFALAVVMVLIAAATMGWLTQAIVVKPMLGQPLLAIVMVTLGLSLILRSITVVFWGAIERSFDTPLPDTIWRVSGMVISTLDIIVILVTLATLGLFALFFRLSNLGLEMRATAESFEAAVLSGVNANRVFSVALALGTVIAAIGGMLLANVNVVNIGMGEAGLLAALPAIVIGGFQSLPGAIVGGLLVGILQKMATGYIAPGTENVVVYTVLLLVLLVRPYGLFGQRDIVRV
jgi:branched-chain amino acid transport system permease protein